MKRLELKIPPVAVSVVFALTMWSLASLTGDHDFNAWFRRSLITVLLAASAVFGLGGVLQFRNAGTTVNPLSPGDSSELVTTGVFQYSRNPMYLALLLVLLALGLALSNLYALTVAALFVPYMNRFQIAPEEHEMARLFGAEYERYSARVRRWI